MTDIFISYSRSDRERIEKLANALDAEGFNVWWDKNLTGGTQFSKEMEERVKEAKAVIVAWSASSIESMWVADEATIGRDKRNLIPICIDNVEPPIGFRQIQTITFNKWKGDPSVVEFQELTAALTAQLTGAPPPVARRANRPKSRLPSKSLLFVGAGLVFLTLVAAVFFLTRGGSEAPSVQVAADKTEPPIESAAATAVYDKSIAVLPFADMSAAGDQEYFSDGISEEILNVLTKIDGLKVAGRTSSFSFKGKTQDLREIGAALNVAHILEGSIRKQGNRVRITAQLIQAEDGFHLWSETYDRELDDIFAIQDEIARAVAEQMKIVLAAEKPLVEKATRDEEAYRLYLEGRAFLSRRLGDNVPKAITLFEKVIARDAGFAEAWSALAVAYYVIDQYVANVDSAAAHGKARESALRAIALNDRLSEPHAVLAMQAFHDKNFVESAQHFDAAFARNPDDPLALLWRGLVVGSLGKTTERLEIAVRLEELEPLAFYGFALRAGAALMLGDIDAAVGAADAADAFGNSSGNYVRSMIANRNGDREGAADYLAAAFLTGSFATDFSNGDVRILSRAAVGDETAFAAVRERIDAYEAAPGRKIEVLPMLSLLGMGDVEGAFDMLEYSRSPLASVFYAELWDPLDKDVRQNSAFRKFAAEKGMVDYWKTYGWPDLCRPDPGTDGAGGQWSCD